MKKNKSGIVIPKPFYQINFNCTHRKFYDVKAKIEQIADDIGMEVNDGYITEKCDYEGDLEEIIIHNEPNRIHSLQLIRNVLKFYECELEELDRYDLHLSC